MPTVEGRKEKEEEGGGKMMHYRHHRLTTTQFSEFSSRARAKEREFNLPDDVDVDGVRTIFTFDSTAH